MIDPSAFRRNLLQWYRRHKRDLPWRKSSDPYRIWISEIMLQQTRVTAVIPYYEHFLQRFPNHQALAAAPEQEVLAAWAGLGYYSRARNLQAAARRIVDLGAFPSTLDEIRSLPGVGRYTAAAIGSIAFGLPHAALDGNFLRVLSRLGAESNETRLSNLAGHLLDPKQPGDFNQAMMELGATVCLPVQPQCLLCPVASHCAARRDGSQQDFPVKRRKPAPVAVGEQLLLIRRKDSYLLWQRPQDSRRMAGFWDLPRAEQLPHANLGNVVGSFRHTIVNTNYRCQLIRATLRKAAPGFAWIPVRQFDQLPLSTTAKKALACMRKLTPAL